MQDSGVAVDGAIRVKAGLISPAFARRVSLLILCGFALAIAGCQTVQRKRRVAVMEFEVAVPGEQNEKFASTIAMLLTDELVQDGRIGVVPRHDVNEILDSRARKGDPISLRRLGQILRVDYLIGGSITQLDGDYILSSRLYSVSTGETVPGTAASKSFRREEDLYPSTQSIARFMAHQIASYDERLRLSEELRTQYEQSKQEEKQFPDRP